MTFRQALALVLVVAGGLPISAQDKPVSAGRDVCELTIEELFGLVEKNSSSLRAEKTGVQFADLGVAAAKTERLPDIQTSFSASYNGNIVMMDRDFSDVHGYSSPHFGNSLAVEARQIVYSGGALSAGIRMAELGREQAATGVELTRQQVRFMALGQYLDLFKIGNRMQVYEQNIKLTRLLIDDIKQKAAQGMALKNDVTRYELQMEQLQLGLRRLHDQRSILNHRLCVTLGLPEGTTIQMSPDIQWPTETDVPEASQSLSPRLRLAQLGVEQAQQRERLARSEMLPKVAVVAADNLNGPITFEIPPINKNLNYWYVGVGVQYPLSSLFKGRKKVEQARVAMRQEQERHSVVAEQLGNDVQEALTLYRQSFADLQTQRKSVELASQNYDVVNNRYLNQLALVTDMIDASNIRLNAELQEVDARIGVLFAYYRLKFAEGTL